MPFNRSIFTTRAITAFFFVIVMLTALLWSDTSFWILVVVIHAGCWVEYQKIIEGFNRSLLYILLGLVYITLSWVFFLDLHHFKFSNATTGITAPAWSQWPLFVFVACGSMILWPISWVHLLEKHLSRLYHLKKPGRVH